MRRLLVLLLLALAADVHAQVPAHARGLLDRLAAIGALADAAEREAQTAALWTALRDAGRIPFAHADTAVFLHRGAATSVAVAGDLTGWSPSLALSRQGASTLWARAVTLPEAARVDYKLVLNGSTWILDPANPHTQMSGFGPNSELRMPAWVFPQETVYQPGIAHGTMGAAVTATSAHYATPVVYRVWTPPGYAAGAARHPVVYVTDGHEYADAALGALPTVVDNLIADGQIEAPILVFVDPRFGGQNRRQEQYVQNPGFARFVAEELVAAVDAAYRTRTGRDDRVILGTSLGGVFSTYLGLQHPDVFGRLAIQSPAYWVSENPQWWTGPSLFQMVAASPAQFTVAMTTGTLNDGEANARRMRDVMLARGHALTYREVPEGHSWGNWRALHDVTLPALLPPTGVAVEPAPGETGLRLDVHPRPAAGAADVVLDLAESGDARVSCVDSLGRTVATLHEGPLAAGRHALRFEAPAAGRFLCRATAGAATATAPAVIVR